jgi:hypothetical protein
MLLKPKGKGAGIMVSDFVDEFNGYLQLSDDQFIEARKQSPEIKKEARVLLEYGEGKEGYWTSERFLSQMKTSVAIADISTLKVRVTRLLGNLIIVVVIMLMMMTLY